MSGSSALKDQATGVQDKISPNVERTDSRRVQNKFWTPTVLNLCWTGFATPSVTLNLA
jgi:hypothetical protein